MHHLLVGVVREVHLIEVSRKLCRQTGSSRGRVEKRRQTGYEFNRSDHTTHTHTHIEQTLDWRHSGDALLQDHSHEEDEAKDFCVCVCV